jgi:8-oxo-dGTP pyrophosphatase MutT (NUDIX family)
MTQIVAAIVTHRSGVLIGRRNDGTPPWTFIAGEIEPGESVFQAAIREVHEETGLHVVPVFMPEIGRRVHPHTGRSIVYVACAPSGATAVSVRDEEELAEVKWATFAEVEELMPDMSPPVHEYLSKVLL